MDYEYTKYVCDKSNVCDTLQNYGVAIIPNVLNQDECENMNNQTWDFFEHISKNWITPLNRTDEQSWKGIYNLFPSHGMLFQHWKIGHSQACWDIRQNKNVAQVFANIWDCNVEDLVSSFDGQSFSVPHEVTKRGYQRKNYWFHCDQSFISSEFKCVQGWVTGYDVNEDDASLAFYEGSHMYHEEFVKQFGITCTKDWYKLNPTEEDFYSQKCVSRKIKCPKGSLVLWDSRTIHCGSQASKERQNRNFRNVIYVCYQPRHHMTQKQLEKKKKAFNELRMTTHWPCKVTLFPKNPRTYGKQLPYISDITYPSLSEFGYKLAGF